MMRGVKNGDVSVGNCYINTITIYEAKQHNFIDYTKISDERNTNRYEMKKLDYSMVLTLVLC